MNPQRRFEELLQDGRDALAVMQNDPSRRVIDVVDHISQLKIAEGKILGFLEAIALLDADLAKQLTPRADRFLADAIAARLLLG